MKLGVAIRNLTKDDTPLRCIKPLSPVWLMLEEYSSKEHQALYTLVKLFYYEALALEISISAILPR